MQIVWGHYMATQFHERKFINDHAIMIYASPSVVFVAFTRNKLLFLRLAAYYSQRIK